jgi:hypothetical protein
MVKQEMRCSLLCKIEMNESFASPNRNALEARSVHTIMDTRLRVPGYLVITWLRIRTRDSNRYVTKQDPRKTDDGRRTDDGLDAFLRTHF